MRRGAAGKVPSGQRRRRRQQELGRRRVALHEGAAPGRPPAAPGIAPAAPGVLGGVGGGRRGHVRRRPPSALSLVASGRGMRVEWQRNFNYPIQVSRSLARADRRISVQLATDSGSKSGTPVGRTGGRCHKCRRIVNSCRPAGRSPPRFFPLLGKFIFENSATKDFRKQKVAFASSVRPFLRLPAWRVNFSRAVADFNASSPDLRRVSCWAVKCFPGTNVFV